MTVLPRTRAPIPAQIQNTAQDIGTAFQFLTRIPIPAAAIPYDPAALSRATRYFPVVGLVIGSGAALLHHLVAPHLPPAPTALAVLIYLVLITGCFHEDGLADAADGLGGGWNRDQILTIMKDSRIGSYGAAALILSLLARFILLLEIPTAQFAPYIISAHVLCRWSSLGLSYALPPATEASGLGSRIAALTSRSSLIAATIFTLAVVLIALHWLALAPIAATLLVTALSGWYYHRRIAGVTGDCFGATNQLVEIAIYVCGVWHP